MALVAFAVLVLAAVIAVVRALGALLDLVSCAVAGVVGIVRLCWEALMQLLRGDVPRRSVRGEGVERLGAVDVQVLRTKSADVATTTARSIAGGARRVVRDARVPTLDDARLALQAIGVVLLVPVAIVLAPFLLLWWMWWAAKGIVVLRRRLKAWEAGGRARATAAAGRQAFISYRTQQHAAAVKTIGQVLDDSGYDPWLDVERGTLPGWTVGLDAFLVDAIRRSQVLVAVCEGGRPPPPLEPGFTEVVDRGIAMSVRAVPWAVVMAAVLSGLPFIAVFAYGVAVAARDPSVREAVLRPRSRLRSVVRYTAPAPALDWWYRRVFHVAILPQRGEPWQAWERRMANVYGVPVVEALVACEDVSSSGRADEERGEAIVLRPDRLAEDVRSRLLPALATTRRIDDSLLGSAHERFCANVAEQVDAVAGRRFAEPLWYLSGGFLRAVLSAARALAPDETSASATARAPAGIDHGDGE